MFSLVRRKRDANQNTDRDTSAPILPDPIENRERDWLDDLTDEERDRVIEKVARAVVKRKMETPAILFLEMHKPVAFLASQSLVVLSPFTGPFVGMDNVQVASKLMEKRENVELLIRRIEELSAEQDARQKPAELSAHEDCSGLRL